ncbi:hypothetical protein DJ71_16310 [Halorubrum sp. E3]|nr:hypothetical protein DJ71_16310 [Halorubrum sp. E3]OYR82584.1 hypothetical protein DJ72_08990 [Halorubrum distributum]
MGAKILAHHTSTLLDLYAFDRGIIEDFIEICLNCGKPNVPQFQSILYHNRWRDIFKIFQSTFGDFA